VDTCLATAIEETMRAHELTTAQLAKRLGMEYNRSNLYRMLNGVTKEPRLGTLVQLCIALETSPSELLELAGVWSPDTPGQATPDDRRPARGVPAGARVVGGHAAAGDAAGRCAGGGVGDGDLGDRRVTDRHGSFV